MTIIPVARVQGDNNNREGKNRGGLAFYVSVDGREQEIGRVAYERTNGEWNELAFEAAVEQVKLRIMKSVDTMRELTEYAGKLL